MCWWVIGGDGVRGKDWLMAQFSSFFFFFVFFFFCCFFSGGGACRPLGILFFEKLEIQLK